MYIWQNSRPLDEATCGGSSLFFSFIDVPIIVDSI